METTAYIDSGILELYVYGLLSESENNEVAKMANDHPEIEKEIISIETAIINLSSSFSPQLSLTQFEKIKEKLAIKHGKVIEMKPKSSWSQYLGWAAAVAIFIGAAYQFMLLNTTKNLALTISNDKEKLQETVVTLKLKNTKAQTALAVIRDTKNTVISLGGQAAAPTASAKVFWNKATQVVYIDASGLPEPPEGMVYQIWSLKLAPQLTPTSIGLLSDFATNDEKLFAVEKTGDAEAFGITLEPAGGSKSPTMEQLYTLGKV
jgi:anti-sigma-K factor RskA